MQNNCPVCGSELKTIPAGVSKKTGKAYNSFTACPNKCKTSWNTSSQSPQTQNLPPTTNANSKDILFVADELQAINKRLNSMAEFLVEKLGDKKDELPPLSEIKF